MLADCMRRALLADIYYIDPFTTRASDVRDCPCCIRLHAFCIASSWVLISLEDVAVIDLIPVVNFARAPKAAPVQRGAGAGCSYPRWREAARCGHGRFDHAEHMCGGKKGGSDRTHPAPRLGRRGASWGRVRSAKSSHERIMACSIDARGRAALEWCGRTARRGR